MDTLLSMKVFATVVESGSFAAAAERLDLSRAMVSKHMAHLEGHLGSRLLNRTTRRLSLTEAGTGYYERCQHILKDIDEAELAATELTSAPRGTLRVTAPLVFGVLHIAPLIADYLALYPEAKLDFTLDDRNIDLVNEGYDLAIRIGNLAESGLVARRFARDRLVVCGSPEYFRRHGVPRVPDDLGKHVCLGYSYEESINEWQFSGPDGEHRVSVSGNLRANNGDLLRVAALGGAGIVLQPRFLVGADLREGRLQAVLTDYESRELGIYAVYPSRRFLSAKVRTFIDFLVERFGPNPDWGA
ncbi:MAG TPA: LysR family transcriptional regulator [Gallionellaceae bacterium]